MKNNEKMTKRKAKNAKKGQKNANKTPLKKIGHYGQ